MAPKERDAVAVCEADAPKLCVAVMEADGLAPKKRDAVAVSEADAPKLCVDVRLAVNDGDAVAVTLSDAP